ncbi:MAG: hypothetical protein ACK4MM_00920 [Fervidobacterium sp.]
MALNKRTIILLVVAIAIWGIAIFVLIRMNSPKTAPLQTTNAPSQPVQPMPTTPNETTPQLESQVGTITNVQKVDNMSFSSIESIIPETTFTEFLKPYVLNLKVSVPTNIFNNEAIVSSVSSSAATSKSSKVTLDEKSLSENLALLSSIEVISTEEIKYLGYVLVKDGKEKIQRIYVNSAGTDKVFLDKELIESRYKILQISQTSLIVLDTLDGKLKKIISDDVN